MKKFFTLFAVAMMAVSSAFADTYPVKATITKDGNVDVLLQEVEIVKTNNEGVYTYDVTIPAANLNGWSMDETTFSNLTADEYDDVSFKGKKVTFTKTGTKMTASVTNGAVEIDSETGDPKESDITIKTNYFTVVYHFFADSEMVTLNAAGYATYSSAAPAQVLSEGVEVYSAAISAEDASVIVLTQEANAIPAETGVILYGEPGAVVYFEEAAEAPAIEINILQATSTTEGIAAVPTGAKIWALGNNQVFQGYKGEFIANRAYISYDIPSESELRMVFADEATAIKSVKASEVKNAKIIENGRVVIVKNGKKFNAAGQLVK